MTYHFTCNTDDNYLQHGCAMLCSLFENNRGMHFHVHLLTKELSHENRMFVRELCEKYGNELSVYDVDEKKLEGVKFRKNRPLTMAAYYRILLPEILDESIDRVLYLDCDIVVLGEVKELYELCLDDLALAACLDASPYTDLHRRQLVLDLKDSTFCSGLMMINLKYWRNNKSEDKLLEYSKREREVVYLHDQDALNYVFKNKWYVLPYKWGVAPYSYAVLDGRQKRFDIDEYVFNPKIIHYASPIKPWLDVWQPRQKYYIRYLKLSEFPNATLEKINMSVRLNVWFSNLRYFVNRYIRPLVPNIIEIIFVDIINIFILLLSLFKGSKALNKFLLNRWIDKY